MPDAADRGRALLASAGRDLDLALARNFHELSLDDAVHVAQAKAQIAMGRILLDILEHMPSALP